MATGEAKRELGMLIAHVPVLLASIGRPTAKVELCSDASMIAGA